MRGKKNHNKNVGKAGETNRLEHGNLISQRKKKHATRGHIEKGEPPRENKQVRGKKKGKIR